MHAEPEASNGGNGNRMPGANPMTRRDQVSISGDDSGLPEDERAVVLERARGLIPKPHGPLLALPALIHTGCKCRAPREGMFR